MGYEESAIAGLILTSLNNFVRPRKLGIVTGPDGTIKLFAGLVRIPDVAFASWDRFPDRKRPRFPSLIWRPISSSRCSARATPSLK